MKVSLQIALLILLVSCQPKDDIEEQKYCDQETELLKGNSEFNAYFDFSLSIDEQIINLQKQVEISLCHGPTPLNVTFRFGESSIETLLMTDWYCVDSTNYLDELPPPPFRSVHSKHIIINAKGQTLIDGEFILTDSISDFIAELSQNFFWNESNKLVAFGIKWDNGTRIEQKSKVFKAVIDGYLQAAKEISIEEFNSQLCNLNSHQLEELKRKFRFTLLIEQVIALPPPPPGAFDEIKVDTLETELEIIK